jgi:hypothetical protein
VASPFCGHFSAASFSVASSFCGLSLPFFHVAATLQFAFQCSESGHLSHFWNQCTTFIQF